MACAVGPVPWARAGWASRNGPELMGLQAALAAFPGRTFLLERGVDRQRLFRWVFGKRFSVKGTCPSRKTTVLLPMRMFALSSQN